MTQPDPAPREQGTDPVEVVLTELERQLPGMTTLSRPHSAVINLEGVVGMAKRQALAEGVVAALRDANLLPAPAEGKWRVGRKVGRTIYLQASDEPSDEDRLIGVMDTPELALEVVEARERPPLTREECEALLIEVNEGHDRNPSPESCHTCAAVAKLRRWLAGQETAG